MGLQLYDRKACYEELKHHIGHEIVCVPYGDPDDPHNVAIECETCGEVLLDYNHPEVDKEFGIIDE